MHTYFSASSLRPIWFTWKHFRCGLCYLQCISVFGAHMCCETDDDFF